ncbi:hypothetical protein EXIGLDRAFT_58422 [Exidia glandulosa HHB12029]|uniref:Uncharacterized protein n=1 Tax=Exidia glandulosa HHB12029 TaxID=1314781 RepID=A0A165I6S6_EXIGL|nr:hypothetical protein EXIGLDRAFT_58422 [Exidia glandulosa HHB12029]
MCTTRPTRVSRTSSRAATTPTYSPNSRDSKESCFPIPRPLAFWLPLPNSMCTLFTNEDCTQNAFNSHLRSARIRGRARKKPLPGSV